jgi:hypothetical protein
MRRVRCDEVKDLVSGSAYVGGLHEGGLNLTWPLANLYVSTDRLVVVPRFGLARLIAPWDFERDDVAYVGARGSLMKESVWIATDAYTRLEFWTWSAREIVDRLRDLGYPCRPHQGPGSIP